MPIFMDRHDLTESVTAEAVAKIHQEDIKIQDQYGCRVLTYWFDEDRKTAFCLIDAPEKKAVSEMHNNAHGMIPNMIIEVNGDVVNAFLGRIENPLDSSDTNEIGKTIINESGYRSIMITSISDFAILKIKYGNDKTNSFIDLHNDFIRQAISHNNGREVKPMRDGFIVSFLSSVKAIECAREIQNNNAKLNTPEFQIRIGVSAGPPVTENPDLFGQAVHLARRLCSLSGRRPIIISSEIREQMLNESSNSSQDGRITQLNSRDEIFLNNLIDVAENYWNKAGFDIKNFGRKLGLSKAQLYRKLTNLCGYSPGEFIKEYKLRKSLEDLEHQTGNISEISYQSGFSSPSYFSKCFLQRFGILPSAFATSLDSH